MDKTYFRDKTGQWWVSLEDQCNLPIDKKINDLMEIAYKMGGKIAVNRTLDHALNSGDGTYRP